MKNKAAGGEQMRHDEPHLGKFEGNASRRLSEVLYAMAGNGLNAELGDVREVEYVADEPICLACRQNRHEYCITKRGFECWCQEEEAHV